MKQGVYFALIVPALLAGCDGTGNRARSETASQTRREAVRRDETARPGASGGATAPAAKIDPESIAGVYGVEGRRGDVQYAHRVTLMPDRRVTFQFTMASPGLSVSPIEKKGTYTLSEDRLVCDFSVNWKDLVRGLVVTQGAELNTTMQSAKSSGWLIPCAEGQRLAFRWSAPEKAILLRDHALKRVEQGPPR